MQHIQNSYCFESNSSFIEQDSTKMDFPSCQIYDGHGSSRFDWNASCTHQKLNKADFPSCQHEHCLDWNSSCMQRDFYKTSIPPCQRYAHGSPYFDLNPSFTQQNSTKEDLHGSSCFYWNSSTEQEIIRVEFPHCRLCHVHVSKCFDCSSLATQQHSNKRNLPLCRLHHVHYRL